LTGFGNPGGITYKKSRFGDAIVDRVAQYVLKNSAQGYKMIEFIPYGYDERQYCSPGINLSVGRLSLTPYGEYPEYHTSADNLDFIKTEYLEDSFIKIAEIISVLENNKSYLNTNPECEPQLGKRGLYNEIGDNEMAMLWVLNFSDGKNSLLDIAQRSNIPFESVLNAAKLLRKSGLLERCSKDSLIFNRQQTTDDLRPTI
jgi:aminopeptidase-like protein